MSPKLKRSEIIALNLCELKAEKESNYSPDLYSNINIVYFPMSILLDRKFGINLFYHTVI